MPQSLAGENPAAYIAQDSIASTDVKFTSNENEEMFTLSQLMAQHAYSNKALLPQVLNMVRS